MAGCHSFFAFVKMYWPEFGKLREVNHTFFAPMLKIAFTKRIFMIILLTFGEKGVQ